MVSRFVERTFIYFVFFILSCFVPFFFIQNKSSFILILIILSILSVCIILRLTIAIFHIFLLGMFAFNKSFSYLSLGIGNIPIYVTELILAFFLLKIALFGIIKKKIKEVKTPLDIPFAVYYSIGLILLFRDLPHYGIEAVRDFVIVYYSLFFYVITENMVSFEDIQKMVKVCFIGSILSVIFFFIRSSIPQLGNAFGPLLSKSIYIAYGMHISITILFCIALRNYLDKRKVFIVAIVSIQLLAVVLTESRSVWVSLAISLIFVFIISKEQRSIILPLGLLIFVVILIWSYSTFFNSTLFNDIYLEGKSIFDSNMQTVSAETSKWRITTGIAGIHQFLRAPLGSGFGRPADMVFLDIVGGSNPSERMLQTDYHNVLLAILVRMGFEGLIVFIWINAVFYYRCIRFCRNTDEPLYRAYMIGILACHLSIAINSMFFQFIQTPYMGIFYWIFMGLGIALINVTKSTLLNGNKAAIT